MVASATLTIVTSSWTSRKARLVAVTVSTNRRSAASDFLSAEISHVMTARIGAAGAHRYMNG